MRRDRYFSVLVVSSLSENGLALSGEATNHDVIMFESAESDICPDRL